MAGVNFLSGYDASPTTEVGSIAQSVSALGTEIRKGIEMRREKGGGKGE